MEKRMIVLGVSEAFSLTDVNFKISSTNPSRVEVFVFGNFITSIDSEEYRLEYKRSYGEYDRFEIAKRYCNKDE